MNSFFILFSEIRLAISNFFAPNFSPEEVGVGDYQVLKIEIGLGDNSYIIHLKDVGRPNPKIRKFKVRSDNAGHIMMHAFDMGIPRRHTLVSLVPGDSFSVDLPKTDQGKGKIFVKS